MYGGFPSWLKRFTLTVTDEYENNLFNEDHNGIDELRFTNDLGCIVGETILIRGEEYIVKAFHIYSNINNSPDNINLEDDYYIQLDIIVLKNK